jgi:hypothetical protein
MYFATPLFCLCQICAKSRPKDTAQFGLPSNGQNYGKRYLYYICAVFDVNTEVLEKPSNRFREPRGSAVKKISYKTTDRLVIVTMQFGTNVAHDQLWETKSHANH